MRSSLDSLTLAELEKDSIYLIHAIDFLFDSGDVRITDGHKDITFDGNDYMATGDLVSFGNIKETQQIEINSMAFSLSAVDLTLVQQALSENFTDRVINLYRGFIDISTYQLVVDPIRVYSGRINSFNVSESPGSTSTLTWRTNSVMADFNRTAGRRSNTEDQLAYLDKIEHSTISVDLGFEFAYQMNYELKWGKS